MVSIVKPDYEIRIGVKDGEVVSQDWSEMIVFDRTIHSIDDIKIINKKLKSYYKQALKKIKDKGQSK